MKTETFGMLGIFEVPMEKEYKVKLFCVACNADDNKVTLLQFQFLKQSMTEKKKKSLKVNIIPSMLQLSKLPNKQG